MEPRQPPRCISSELSTDGIRPKDAYEFWCARAFGFFEPDRPTHAVKTDGFHAHSKGLVAQRGEFYVLQCDPLSGSRTLNKFRQDGGDDLDIGLVFSGQWQQSPQDDIETSARPDDFFFYDAARPSRVRWDTFHGVYLTLRRLDVMTALKGKVPPVSLLAARLASSHLAPFLRSQITLLAQHMDNLSLGEQALLLDSTIDLALAALGGSIDQPQEDSTCARHGVFVAAQRFIDANLHNPDLDIVDIADAIGCSRATLYRAFSDQEQTVASYIMSQRLHRFTRLLQTTDNSMTITALAQTCGFRDVANFNKIFRRRFGMSPSDARRTWQA